jgi:CheY-like chemotaxis protein
MNVPEFPTKHIFVADDKEEDQRLFQEVIDDLPYLIYLTKADNGEDTIKILNHLEQLPDVIFLDLSIPGKDGFECLKEIKQSKKLQSLPVIIFSSSTYPGAINQAYEDGAHLYIRKPADFLNFKKSVHYVLRVNWKSELSQPPRDEFVLDLFPEGDR